MDSVEGSNSAEEAEGTKRAEVVESKEGTKSIHAEEIVKVAVDCDVPVVFIFSADSSLLKVQLSCASFMFFNFFYILFKFFVGNIWPIA